MTRPSHRSPSTIIPASLSSPPSPSSGTPFALSEFAWCQVLYLYARELNLAGSGWENALKEATTLVGILQEKRNDLVDLPGVRSNTHVYWPDLICAANIYARMPIEVRAEALTRLHDEARPLPTVHIGLTDLACERRAQTDEEYLPEPPCLPSEPVKGAWMGVGMFLIVSSAMVLHKAVAGQKARPSQREDRRPSPRSRRR